MPVATPLSTPIDWLSKVAYPVLSQQTRQIEGFYPGDLGRLPWSVNSVTGDGTVGLQWLDANLEKITAPKDAGPPLDDLVTDQNIYLEVDLPRLTQNLEFGGYVSPSESSGIDPTYYNTALFFQHPYMDWKNVRVVANDPSASGYDSESPWTGYVYWRTATHDPNNPVDTGNPTTFVHDANNGLQADHLEIDYKAKKLRLRFDAGASFPNYSGSIDSFNYKQWLDSDARLLAGSYLGPEGLPTSDVWAPGWYGRHVNPARANRIGVVYQGKDYDEQVTQSFRAMNPDYSLYTTLGSAGDTDSVWFLLDSPTNSNVNNSVTESEADPTGPDDGTIYPAPSQLLTVAGKNQITLNLTTQSVGSRKQLGQIANSKTSASGLTFSVFEKDVSSNVKPTSYRADIDDTDGAVSPTTATITLKPDQLDYGKRETTVDTNTAEVTA
ncbi:MAG: hypothetical protein ABGZ17_09150, partial [Planctomycetaceae bacterium]